LNDREKYWIAYYKSHNPKYGYNKTLGGDGLVATDEIRIKISKSLTGIKHSNGRRLNESISHLGHRVSEETKAKQSLVGRNRFGNPENIIKHQLAMSKKSIIQLTLDDVQVAEFISIREAERITKIHSSDIARVCTNERKTAGGFKWKYK
jgi:hypothetical protein